MFTFGKGCQGFLVVALQEALERGLGRRLPSGADGKYGNEVMDGVRDFAAAMPTELQTPMRAERAFFGQAGPAVFTALGVEWPELFARCLMLTSIFEGTGFSGAEGPKQTGDSAGVTFGLIGFTSYNGELQELLRTASVDHPDEFTYCGTGTLGVGPFYQMLQLIKDDAGNGEFGRWALTTGGDVRPAAKSWLNALGGLPWMRHLEMQWAFSRYWSIAKRDARKLFGIEPDGNGQARTDTDARVFALMFDVAVQDGGMKSGEIDDLTWTFSHGVTMTVTDKMHEVNTRLIQRLRDANRPAKIIDDVRSRKGCIATGSGRVHGADVVVRGFGI